MQFLSIYSKRDGIVDWEACLDESAVNAEVLSTHCGMAVNTEVYELLDVALHPGVGAGRRAHARPAVARAARLEHGVKPRWHPADTQLSNGST